MSLLHQVYLSLGANLGNRQANILQALQYVQTRTSIKQISSFYETEPVGYADQPKFLNITCELVTEHSPVDLLHFLKWIEKRMGRQALFQNAPRPIDIDILLCDDQSINNTHLRIPHKYLKERQFVLQPISELTDEIKIEGQKHNTEALIQMCPDKCKVTKLNLDW